MKILIIGNGFDVAHDLPTKYTDFLERTKLFFGYCENNSIDNVLGKSFNDALKQHGMYDEFREFEDNIWLKYFTEKWEKDKLKGDTWIDFESEIFDVVKTYETKDSTRLNEMITDEISQPQKFFISKFRKFLVESQKSKKPIPFNNRSSAFSEFLFSNLKKLTRAFEIYCICVINKSVIDFYNLHNLENLREEIAKASVESVELERTLNDTTRYLARERLSKNKNTLRELEYEVELISQNYDKAQTDLNSLREQDNSLCCLAIRDFDAVLSFNYTNTFETLYGMDKTNYCYIHGKAQPESDKADMILGINDTLDGDAADSLFVFAKFKKYFQRIINKTGSEYKDWIQKISNTRRLSQVYILGHSLGKTDHDILREFFDAGQNNNNVKITIFYHDEVSEIRVVEKTIEIIGKENLIRRVHGSDWNVRFVNQYDEEQGIMKKT
ncbi:MAG: bacteriophage abortive infection AbiH family protein [Defluviitaleaceae bacterium]|nr:bacteriophage abortive infection AbiH family protein [Defluviitaleaceae bacterium]MCL2263611.1 bacteriophage abortive infection AbiH family protein [Defluviitaleaceae bacterium]